MNLSTNNNDNEPRIPKHLKDEPSNRDMGKRYKHRVSYPTRSIKHYANANTKHLYIITARTVSIAAFLAADRNLHLRSWAWFESDTVGVFINEKYIKKTTRSNDESTY